MKYERLLLRALHLTLRHALQEDLGDEGASEAGLACEARDLLKDISDALYPDGMPAGYR